MKKHHSDVDYTHYSVTRTLTPNRTPTTLFLAFTDPAYLVLYAQALHFRCYLWLCGLRITWRHGASRFARCSAIFSRRHAAGDHSVAATRSLGHHTAATHLVGVCSSPDSRLF